jgi:hypothetical protein
VKLQPEELTPKDRALLQRVADRLRHLIAIPTTNFVHDATLKPAPDLKLLRAAVSYRGWIRTTRIRTSETMSLNRVRSGNLGVLFALD